METDDPARPLDGVNVEMLGATRKLLLVVAVPLLVVTTLNGPLLAPIGTTTVNCVSELTTKSPKVDAIGSKTTLLAVVKPDPLIVITLPGWPNGGEKPLMVADASAWRAVNKSGTGQQMPSTDNCFAQIHGLPIPPVRRRWYAP